MSDNTVEIIIKATADRAISEVKKLMSGFGQHFDGMKTKAAAAMKSVANSIASVGRGLLNLKTLAVGALVGWGIERLVSKWEAASGSAQKAEAGMVAAMKSMGRYSDEFYKNTMQTASALQELSTFEDDAILQGAKFLMTYEAIGNDVMPRVMKTMTDIAALMGGDFTSAANMLGKASMGMTGELRRVGITVDEDTFKMQGFLGVLKQIEKQVSGQAEALASTDTGKLEAFGNRIGDIEEKLGAFTLKVKAELIDKAIPYVKQLDEYLAEITKSGEMETWAVRTGDAIVRAFKASVIAVNDLIAATKGAYEIFKAFQWGLSETMSMMSAKVAELKKNVGVYTFGSSKEGEVAYGIVKGPAAGTVRYTTQGQHESIQKWQGSADAWDYVSAETARQYEQGVGSFERASNALNSITESANNVAAAVNNATQQTAQFFDFTAAQQGRDPFTFTPKITMSPAVPWREGIANMEADLAGLGESMTGAMDLSSVSSMISSMTDMAAQIRELGKYQDLTWVNPTPGLRKRVGKEIGQYENLIDVQMKILNRMAYGGQPTAVGGQTAGGGVVVNINGLTINGPSSMSAADMLAQMEAGVAQNIKYGRSEILLALQKAGIN